jgi:hypothetical protein
VVVAVVVVTALKVAPPTPMAALEILLLSVLYRAMQEVVRAIMDFPVVVVEPVQLALIPIILVVALDRQEQEATD